MKNIFWFIEDLVWNVRCSYNLWLHGPYGLSKVIEKIPFRFLIKYLRKYGATVGEDCRFERGLNIHRPLGKKPFENLIIGNNVYLGHNTLIDLSRKVILKDRVIFASRCQIWTHASYYEGNTIENHQYGEHYGDVIINEGALIYSNTVITHGNEIGKFAVIGANSLVNKSIPENEFWGGVPVRKIK
ncbi:MAG: acyltransferase [Bacteroidales bacterium]